MKGIDIEPYHPLGEGKYAAPGKPTATFRRFSDEKIEAIPVKKA